MRISDWSSDVCSSDLIRAEQGVQASHGVSASGDYGLQQHAERIFDQLLVSGEELGAHGAVHHTVIDREGAAHHRGDGERAVLRSEEHTSELQSLMRISYAVFCLKKKKTTITHTRSTRS